MLFMLVLLYYLNICWFNKSFNSTDVGFLWRFITTLVGFLLFISTYVGLIISINATHVVLFSFNIHTDVGLFLYLNTCMDNIAIFEPFYYTLLALNQQVLF